MLESTCITHVMSPAVQLEKQTCQDMLETTWITHVMSPAAQLGKQTCQDTVGNHLNQWWNVTCRWGWTTNMPRHTRPPPDSRPNFWCTLCCSRNIHSFPTITNQDQVDSDMMSSHETSHSHTPPQPMPDASTRSTRIELVRTHSLQAVHPWSPVIT